MGILSVGVPGRIRLLREGVAHARSSRFVAIATSLLGTHMVTGVLGLVFWTVAARGMPPSAVGHLGSATAAALMLGLAGMLGCGTLLISRIGGTEGERRRQLLLSCLMVAGGAGSLFASVFGVVVSWLLPAYAFLTPTEAAFWWMVAITVLAATGGVTDQVMLVLGRPIMQTVRNAVASAVKIAILVAVILYDREQVSSALAAWALGQLVANLLAWRVAWRNTPTRQRVSVGDVGRDAVRHWREALSHHGVNMALTAPTAIQPVIIAAAVSSELNAVFTTTRLIGELAFMVPYALAVALFASTVGDGPALRAQATRVLRLSLLLSCGVCAVTIAAAPLVLWIFGGDYGSTGAPMLRLYILACPLLVFKDQYIAQARASRSLGRAMRYVLVVTTVEISATLVGALVAEVTGAVLAWLAALAGGAVWIVAQWRADRLRQARAGDNAGDGPGDNAGDGPGGRRAPP